MKLNGRSQNIFNQIELNPETSETLFELFLDLTQEFVISLNKEGYFQNVNSYGARLIDYNADELKGKHFLDLVEEKDKMTVSGAFQNILQSNNKISFKANINTKFGNTITFEFTAKPVINENEFTGLIAIGKDISNIGKEEQKLKNLNAKLIEANRIISIEKDRAQQKVSILEELNKLKNDFISNISHELRTPLASIVGFSETIENDKELDFEKVKEFNRIILEESKRLAKLVEDILDLSKLEQDKDTLIKSDFDLISLLKDLEKSFSKTAREKGLIFTIEVPEAEIIINGDKDRISKALSNLILNGIKFTDNGGRVTVIVQDFLRETEIIISDTGKGIPDDQIPFLFEKFNKIETQQKNTKGSGLGLVTVKKIIDLHKGLIRVKSEVNKGTTFIIKLPKL